MLPLFLKHSNEWYGIKYWHNFLQVHVLTFSTVTNDFFKCSVIVMYWLWVFEIKYMKQLYYSTNFAVYECLNVVIVLDDKILLHDQIHGIMSRFCTKCIIRTCNLNWYAYSLQYMAEIVILVNHTQCYGLTALVSEKKLYILVLYCKVRG